MSMVMPNLIQLNLETCWTLKQSTLSIDTLWIISKKLDINDDGQISKAEFSEDMVAMEMALGMDVDQNGINSFFDTIDSNGDGHINLGEFYAINNQRVEWKNKSKGEDRRFSWDAWEAQFD